MGRYIEEEEIVAALTEKEGQQWNRFIRQIDDATTVMYFARKHLREMRARVRRRIRKTNP